MQELLKKYINKHKYIHKTLHRLKTHTKILFDKPQNTIHTVSKKLYPWQRTKQQIIK